MAAAAFAIRFKKNRLKVMVRANYYFDLIWFLDKTYGGLGINTSEKNQTQINKDNIGKNRKRVDHDYKVGYKVMLNNHYAYKYETPYKGPFLIT